LKAGADPNARDIHDNTPLHYAYMNYDKCQNIIALLEKHGSDKEIKNIFGRDPIFYKNKMNNNWGPTNAWNI
jgi:ankyrin repeat protein